MFWSTGLILVLAINQVPTELVKPKFIENVINAALKNSERIASGWEAYLGQIPYYAFLRLVDSAGGLRSCGGSVVSRDWVLTSAACTARRISAVVHAGLTRFTDPKPEYIFETHEFYIYPTYNQSDVAVQLNAISIVKLQKPVTYTSVLQPIRLQSSAEAFRNYENEVVVASGFGITWANAAASDVLRWVYLRAISNPTCLQRYSPQYVSANTICTTYYNVTSQNICNNDVGGPLVHMNGDGVPILIGITSFFSGACGTGTPSGFLRPGPFHFWLKEITGIDFENLDESTTLQPTTEPATTASPEITELPGTTQTEYSSTTVQSTKPPTPEPEKECEKDSKAMVEVLVKVKVKVNDNHRNEVDVE